MNDHIQGLSKGQRALVKYLQRVFQPLMLMQTVKVCQFSNNWGLWLIIYMIEAQNLLETTDKQSFMIIQQESSGADEGRGHRIAQKPMETHGISLKDPCSNSYSIIKEHVGYGFSSQICARIKLCTDLSPVQAISVEIESSTKTTYVRVTQYRRL